jgi:hypothetical protein
VYCLALWAAGKHQALRTGAQVGDNLTLIDLRFNGFFRAGCQKTISIKVGLEAGTNPLLSFVHGHLLFLISANPGIKPIDVFDLIFTDDLAGTFLIGGLFDLFTDGLFGAFIGLVDYHLIITQLGNFQ